ncbi:MAG: NADPH:quinone oxidoreductase family protein [Acidimicrobiia bacterium]|nr:NADPH:quinone oxidoreductase family protein [Acidimicrobiia bacterium]
MAAGALTPPPPDAGDVSLAWQVERLGEPADVLVLTERASPRPGPGEVVVDVEACGLNFADGLLCRGRYQQRPDLPFTPGLEVAGNVVDAGPGVDLAHGDPVVGSPILPHGGLAARCLLRADAAVRRPPALSAVVAAGSIITYPTPRAALGRRAGVRPGDTVVVHAAAGGTGSACAAVARALGAEVVATAGGADKVARCLQDGAAAAIDHRREDVAERVLALTDGRGADVIVDTVGGDLFDAATHCLAFEGRLVVLGFASGRIPNLAVNHPMVKNYDVVGVQWPAYPAIRPAVAAQAAEAVVTWLTEGTVPPPTISEVPFGEASAALARLVEGSTTGKLVVVPSRGDHPH